MTRGQEIINAIEKIFLVTKDCKATYEMIGFRLGAEWADSNPKSPWISVEDDLPCNHEELLNPNGKGETSYVVAIIHNYVIMSRMYKLKDKWYWENDEPTHWFPIPKLP